MPPKYSLQEIERRWEVDPSKLPPLEGVDSWLIEDRYLQGSRLRLRKMRRDGSEPVYKFCKKYGPDGEFSEPITNLYLSDAEYKLLAEIPADVVVKRRYALSGGSLDVEQQPIQGRLRFEVEFESEEEARSYIPPDFVRQEVPRFKVES